MSLDTEVIVKENDIIDIILDYLHQYGYFKAMRALEEESGRILNHFGKDVMFFRSLVLDGKWEDVESFIQPLEGLSSRYNEVLFQLWRQRFLEMLDVSNEQSDLTQVTELLKSMEHLCPQESFHSLCYCLTLPSIQNHPDFTKWTVFGGRMNCFNTVVECLESIFPDQTLPTSRVSPKHLLTLCKQAILYQADAYFLSHPNEDVPQKILADLTSADFTSKAVQKLPETSEPQRKPQVSLRNTVAFSAGLSSQTNYPGPNRTLQQNNGPTANTKQEIMHSFDSNLPRNAHSFVKQDYLARPEKNAGESYDRRQSDGARSVDDLELEEEKLRDDPSLAHRRSASVGKAKGMAWNLDVGEFKGAKATRAPREELRVGRLSEPLSSKPAEIPSSPPQNRESQIKNYNIPVREEKLQGPSSSRPYVRAGGFAPTASMPPGKETSIPMQGRPARKYSGSHQTMSDSYSNLPWDNLKDWSGSLLLRESHPIRAVSFSPDGQYFALGTNNKVMTVLNAPYSTGSRQLPKTEVLLQRSDHHRGSVYCLSWDSSSALIATGSNDKCIKVCKLHPTERGQLDCQVEEDVVLRHHNGTIRSLSFTPEQGCQRILSGGAGDFCPRLWDVNSGSTEPIQLMHAHKGIIFCARFSEDGSLGLSAGEDGFVKIWDFRSGNCEQEVSSLESKSGSVLAASFSPGSHNLELATSHEDGTCLIWDLRQREVKLKLSNHTQEVRTLHYSPGGQMLLTGSFDFRTSLYDVTSSSEDYEFLTSLEGHSGRILEASWNPVEPSILTSSADCSVIFWRPKA